MVSWLLILAVSTGIGLLLAKTIGSHLRQWTLLVLSILNLTGISAVLLMLIMPVHSEAQVYTYAEIAPVLIIILLCLVPSTVFFWVVRLTKNRQIP